MTPRAFCQPEVANQFKGAVHGVMLAGATACAVYNIAACILRKPERHLVVNSLIYSALVVLEIAHVRHHADQRNDYAK